MLTISQPSLSEPSTSDESVDLLEKSVGVPPDSSNVRLGSTGVLFSEGFEEEEGGHLVVGSLGDDAGSEGGSSDESGGLDREEEDARGQREY